MPECALGRGELTGLAGAVDVCSSGTHCCFWISAETLGCMNTEDVRAPESLWQSGVSPGEIHS